MYPVPFPKEALQEMKCKGAILHAPEGFEDWVKPMPIGVNDNSIFIMWQLEESDLKNLEELPILVMQIHSHNVAPINLSTVENNNNEDPTRLQEAESEESNGNASVFNLFPEKK